MLYRRKRGGARSYRAIVCRGENDLTANITPRVYLRPVYSAGSFRFHVMAFLFPVFRRSLSIVVFSFFFAFPLFILLAVTRYHALLIAGVNQQSCIGGENKYRRRGEKSDQLP